MSGYKHGVPQWLNPCFHCVQRYLAANGGCKNKRVSSIFNKATVSGKSVGGIMEKTGVKDRGLA